jgi:4-hydroxybenzoyl-CoA thioesterase/acyl-CoA thioester hydrolase
VDAPGDRVDAPGHRVDAPGHRVDSPAPPEAFIARRRVEFRDTDAAGIAHFSAFFPWMEAAEHELLRSIDVPVMATLPNGATASWPRVSASCDYRSAVRFGDELEIAVWLAAIGRSSVTYAFRFTHAQRLVAEGRIVAVHCRMEGSERPVPAALPAGLLERLRPFLVAGS